MGALRARRAARGGTGGRARAALRRSRPAPSTGLRAERAGPHDRCPAVRAAALHREDGRRVMPRPAAVARDVSVCRVCGRESCEGHLPPTPLERVEQIFARWIRDDDPIPTRAVLAAYVANRKLDGDPVWMMLVGGSGVGKTERLMPLSAMPD